jgi:hypothetical protein
MSLDIEGADKVSILGYLIERIEGDGSVEQEEKIMKSW